MLPKKKMQNIKIKLMKNNKEIYKQYDFKYNRKRNI